VHPTAFHIGDLPIAWYGILLATGFMVGMWTAGRRGMKIGLNAEDISNLMMCLFVGGIAGAKLLFVINHFGQEPLKDLVLSRSGMVFHGAFFGACAAVWLFTRKVKMPLWATFDTLAPSFALGHAFGRIGCFMTGCCYGNTCSLPWAVQFPEGHTTHPNHIHPTQIYESLLNFSTYIVLAWLFRRRKFDGQVIAAYMLIYAIVRFGLEFFRADGRGKSWFGALSSGQDISILLLIGGGALWWLLRERNALPKPEEA
jgi:phosphatidylglycerol:prolipoprotein diacylglycerol transferase